jgi:hypothetical protein
MISIDENGKEKENLKHQEGLMP